MDSVTRNVKDIDSTDRQALERLLGYSLRENQQLIIKVVNLGNQDAAKNETPPADDQTLPDWCNVYEGLSDDEIEQLEQTILTRADLSRTTE